MQSHCIILLKQMQCRASVVGKMKIEPAVISFIQDGGQKLWFYHQRKLQIFLYFLKVPNGWQDGQKAGNSWETSRIFFFWWSPTKLIQQATFLVVLVYRNMTFRRIEFKQNLEKTNSCKQNFAVMAVLKQKFWEKKIQSKTNSKILW